MIKLYTNQFQERLLEVFDSNVPNYFDPSEKTQFLDYIKNVPVNYFVFEKNSQIISSGGFAFETPTEGRIVWLMVDNNYHSNGIGRKLMTHFETELMKYPEVNLISLMTSQHTDQFYEKLGYTTTRKENDYWAKGMHLYYMEKKI